jgi:PAS domain S-box-containing protein
MPKNRPSAFRGYALSIGAVALAAAARYGMWGVLGETLPYLFFFAAIMASGWFGGLRPGLLATGLSAAVATVGTMTVPAGFEPTRARDILGLASFILVGVGISVLCENLHRAQRRMEVTLRSIGDAVIVTDVQGRVRSMNPIAEALTGWTEIEAAGQPLEMVFRIVNEETRETVESPARRALREGAVVGLANHTLLLAKDGRETAIDDSAAPVRDEHGVISGCVLVFRDVTPRRQAERTNALLAAVVESSDDAIVSKTLDGTILSWNAGAERLFGYAAREAVGRSITLIIPQDRLQEETSILERLRRGERVDHFETVRRTKDGRAVEVSITSSPVRDAAGKIVGASKVARDITERRLLERERRESDRRKDEFLATLAHELRNPLAPIRNAVEILRRSGIPEDPGGDALDIMERQLGQMVRLIDDLLDVSRISRGKIELKRGRFDLTTAIRHAVESSRPHIEAAGQQLVLRVPDGPLHVEADMQRLAQVFANLLNNASKFTPPGGTITLEARSGNPDVLVSVHDDGVGIPPEKLTSIFDLFTQLDTRVEREQGGLGIGLTLGKRIVELHGGTIEAKSEGAGRGSTFIVRLPV